MENIEIKACYPDLPKAHSIAEKIGATFEGVLLQTDTYFNVANGRLKLREINSKDGELIYYERPNQAGPKSSNYEICSIQDPAQLKATLALALGVLVVVEKKRDLYLYEEVRIHLDSVASLGAFLEFEGVVEKAISRDVAQQKVEWLLTQFQIAPGDLIESSYSDMIERIN